MLQTPRSRLLKGKEAMITAEALRKYVNQPQAFEIHLADGRARDLFWSEVVFRIIFPARCPIYG